MDSEEREQMKLAAYLDGRKFLWCHVPNGGHRRKVVAASLKRQGVKSGVPDVLIFAPIQAAIELKRKSGGSVSANQSKWLDALGNAGWETYVARGADKAIEWLIERVGCETSEEDKEQDEKPKADD
tara:strand:+ start:639 stop:1016 length:378 start_codon:yes stop_codon:yes gene_type:complete